jgi:Viral BACON domain
MVFKLQGEKMRRLTSVLLAAFLAVSLASCGGGGGGAPSGGGSNSPLLTFSPSTIKASLKEGASATLNVRATLTNPSVIDGNVYVYVADSKGVLADFDLRPLDDTSIEVSLYTKGTLSLGKHQGAFEINLCRDVNCAAQYPGSPVALPYDLTVTEGPLFAFANQSTAASVHFGASLTNVVSVSVNGPNLNWTATASANWLRLTPTTGKGTGSFGVSYVAAGLAVGSHTATVTVRASDGQAVDVPFSLEVLPTQFVLNSGVASFSAVNGAPIPAQSVSVDFDGNASLPWSALSTAPWLAVSPLVGSTPASVTLQPDPSKGPLASGSYSAAVVLSSSGITSKTITTNLMLIKPTLSAPATVITLGGDKGRELNFGGPIVFGNSVVLSLNTESNKWPWTLSTLPTWVTASATTGLVSQGPALVTFFSNAANVQPGTSSGAATITARVNADEVTLPVTLKLNVDQRRLLASEWGVAFATTPTGTTLNRTLKISDNFGGALAWTATSDSAWLTATSSGTTGPSSSIALSADASALPSGTMSYANITVSTNVAGVESATIQVGLWKDAIGLTAITKLPLDYSNIVADKIRPFVYATNGGTSVDVFHAYSAQKVGSFPNLGASLRGMAVSPDGGLLYVLDTANLKTVAVNLKTGAKSHDWFISSGVDGNTSLVATRPNGVEVVLLGDGTAYTKLGRSLGGTRLFGPLVATLDGTKVFTGGGAFRLDYSAVSGGVLMTNLVGVAGGGDRDVAVSPDASRVYLAAGFPYKCSVADANSLTSIGSLPGGEAYPNNVEVTSDGRAICGIFGWYAAADFWVHSANGVLLQNHKVAGYAKAMKDRQMVVSPDGFVVVALTDDPLIAFVPIGP